MTKQRKQRKLPKRNYLVLVVKKSGAGKHKDRKKEQKRTHQE